jgi:hypothetical protein
MYSMKESSGGSLPERDPGGSRGCLVSVIVAGAVLVAALLTFIIWVGVSARDTTSMGYQILSVIRGEASAEDLVTKIIIRRLAEKANVPPAETAKLEREIQPLAADLPYLSEGEKHKLAMLIRESMTDGRIEDAEIRQIKEYSYRSARDKDTKP